MKGKIFLILLTVICLIHIALADGCVFVPDYYEHVYLPSQKAAIFWDGINETMILSTRIGTENLTNLAWIIPLPSKIKPEVEKGDIHIFYDLADLFTPRREKGGWDILGVAHIQEKGGVQVIEEKKVDIHDITILKATNASALVDWLNRHGYIVPETSVSILQEYCNKKDFYFIANKINLANKYENLTITETDRKCARYIHTLPHYYYPNFPEEYTRQYLEGIMKYKKECENASLQAVKILVELKQGIATPLKFTFQPEKPFYPLKISSINEGGTNISVYVFSETPVKDEKNILSIHNMIKLEKYWREKYNLTNEKYVTLLKYEGDLKGLNEDSFFIPTKYEPKLNPNYVPLNERILGLLEVIIFILIFLVPFSLLIIMPPFIIGYLIKKCSNKIKNKKLYYLPLLLSILGCLALSLKMPWLLIPIICISLLDGFYAAYKNSRKKIWVTTLLALIVCVGVLIFV